MHLFIVTEYGCNSTPGDLWIPISKLFTSYAEAYAHFEAISTVCLDGEVYVNKAYDPKSESNEYIVIEDRSDHYAKRPCGVVIARYGV
jgi:hypothetical protein